MLLDSHPRHAGLGYCKSLWQQGHWHAASRAYCILHIAYCTLRTACCLLWRLHHCHTNSYINKLKFLVNFYILINPPCFDEAELGCLSWMYCRLEIVLSILYCCLIHCFITVSQILCTANSNFWCVKSVTRTAYTVEPNQNTQYNIT